MIYKGQTVKPKKGDLCRWNDENSEWFGFIANIWKDSVNVEHVIFHFGDGSKQCLKTYQCQNFKIIARAGEG